MDEETLIIFLPKEQRFLMSEIYRSERLFITVGGVAHNTYELLGLPKAIDMLSSTLRIFARILDAGPEDCRFRNNAGGLFDAGCHASEGAERNPSFLRQ